MYCQYLSHKRSNHLALAELDASYVKSIQPDGSICIRTCHRLEFYANMPFELPEPPEAIGSSWTQVSGLLSVLIRLANLSAGIESRILGEQFVAYQCSRPFLRSHNPHLPFGLIGDTFEIASRLKKSYGFNTSFSYDDAAFSLLDTDRRCPKPSHLVIFGAGLLGQAVAEHASARKYQSIQVITRKPNDLTKIMGSTKEHLSIQASTLGDAELPTAYDCVIATDNRSAAFSTAVNSLLSARIDGNVVDLCAVPVISDAMRNLGGVFHMGSTLMQSLIDEANADLEHLVDPLTASISDAVTDLYTSYRNE